MIKSICVARTHTQRESEKKPFEFYYYYKFEFRCWSVADMIIRGSERNSHRQRIIMLQPLAHFDRGKRRIHKLMFECNFMHAFFVIALQTMKIFILFYCWLNKLVHTSNQPNLKHITVRVFFPRWKIKTRSDPSLRQYTNSWNISTYIAS